MSCLSKLKLKKLYRHIKACGSTKISNLIRRSCSGNAYRYWDAEIIHFKWTCGETFLHQNAEYKNFKIIGAMKLRVEERTVKIN